MKFRSSALDVMGDRSTIFPVALIPANRPGVIPKIPGNAMDNDPGRAPYRTLSLARLSVGRRDEIGSILVANAHQVQPFRDQ